ncbi:MAG: hypothetical protein IH991_13540 [Planctomycetes bacterium]|nr:hypothetical protein [Planctomycetota bacterium]
MPKRVKCPECRREFDDESALTADAHGDVRLHGTLNAFTQKTQRGRMTGKGIALRLIALTIFLAASTTAIIVIAQRVKKRLSYLTTRRDQQRLEMQTRFRVPTAQRRTE